jgi:hypothetical protein
MDVDDGRNSGANPAVPIPSHYAELTYLVRHVCSGSTWSGPVWEGKGEEWKGQE